MRRAISLVLMMTAVSACGGESSDAPASDVTGSPVTTSAPETDDPATLGAEIGAVYVQAYEDVVTVLAERPDPDTAAVVLADLKEDTIEQMVALGHRRETFDEAGRAVVDAAIRSSLSALSSETFEAYSQAASDYVGDPEVAALIADFNIIGQYANFDLLREQDPEEAARLGVG
jgi:hypothetical protein